ncbi:MULTISPECIES: efflux RND transporter periplasmic adaptor subunit [Psychrilyobacter]|uniref:Efflux RND transporter periplasmic adaptor subunit n=1 Tax=Psychrilyobacter piezotolerans TaxID=2293438 RepID=A0ABX9KGK9_9FUSO|nr:MULTISPECIES: efflux RND transporter periplasmic adaptor subunit [Psychrilyobacter]MCS5420351.1 efflux RND transporter periplasmic adaptor subunit [Psychrilyobacter sp. S5]NDI78067.1 efflux RND transporter periplasmic adaptor subunit [Psychrilyobacter piezotolerans]RDE61658.1 efflux RND transporter periplasmic adaptor subunit [Psychrilyobacter sp. S5]REI41050.1 efflux RND transporter periplasmic adaptor subunit [Psychrilyobacter piezotolerans]
MNKIMKQMAILLVGLSLVACGKKEEIVKGKEEINYKNVKVVDADLSHINKVSVSSGSLDSINEMEEITKTRVDVIKINYKNGDKVRVGDVVLVLENQDVKSAYLDSKARVISAKADYETQKTTYNKYEILYNEKLISEEEFLNIKNKLASSEGTYRSAVAALLKNEKDYNDLTVKAKINGTIADLDLKLYQKIEKEQPLFKVVDNDSLRILSGVSSQDVIGLKTEATANIYVEDSLEPVQGSLYEINPIANSSTRKFEVKIKIENEDSKYKQGMFAKVELYTGKKEGILVPKKAVIVEELYSYIFVVDKENIESENYIVKETNERLVARKIRVNVGISNGENCEVISSDLKESNKVVVAGQYSLNDGDYIKEEN